MRSSQISHVENSKSFTLTLNYYNFIILLDQRINMNLVNLRHCLNLCKLEEKETRHPKWVEMHNNG